MALRFPGWPLKRRAATISDKLGVVFGAALLLSIGIGLFSLHQLRIVNDATHEIREQWLPKLSALSYMNKAAGEHRLLADQSLSFLARSEEQRLNDALKYAGVTLERWRSDLIGRPQSPEEAIRLSAFDRNWDAYLQAQRAAFALFENGRVGEARRLFRVEASAAHTAAQAALRRLLENAERMSRRAELDAAQRYDGAETMISAAILAACALTIASTFWVSVTITAPLQCVTDTMARLVRGEDSVCLNKLRNRSDEIGVLADAARGYRDTLTQSRRLAREAETGRRRLETAIRNMPIGLTMFDRDEQLVVSNGPVCEIYGLPPDVMQPGLSHLELMAALNAPKMFSAEDLEDYREKRQRLIERGEPFTLVVPTFQGRVVEVEYQPLDGGGWVALHEDVTERQMAQEKITYLARYDRLTDLANRHSFDEALAAALATCGADGSTAQVALLFLDLDRFKPVNDTYGHAVGDALLQAVARRLTRVTRSADTVARLGGDEFAVVQADREQPEAALATAARAIEALSRPFRVLDHDIEIGVSVGIALAPRHADEPAELLRCADAALYCAKAEGRGVFRLYEPSMDFGPARESA